MVGVDGYYTWWLTDSGEVVPTYSKLRVTVFTGSSIEDMQLVAESGPDAAPFDFVLQAVGGQRYWISAGFPAGDITAYTQRTASARVIWGPTPVNDSLSSAVPLVGSAGSITGSNRFATIERGERPSVTRLYGGPTKHPLPAGIASGSMSSTLPGCWPSTRTPATGSDRLSS